MSLFRHVPREALQLDDDAFECIQRNYTAWREERVDAFVSARSPGMPADWTECDDRTRFIELDAFRAQHGREHAIDFHVVRSAHQWGPLPRTRNNGGGETRLDPVLAFRADDDC